MHKEIEENIGNLLQELSSNKKIGHDGFNIRNIIVSPFLRVIRLWGY